MRREVKMYKELDNILSSIYHKKILIELDELLKILLTYNIIADENIL